MSKWTRVLTASEIADQFDLAASLDPSFAVQSRAFWSAQTAEQLLALKCQAWDCNDADQYQMASSYLALIT